MPGGARQRREVPRGDPKVADTSAWPWSSSSVPGDVVSREEIENDWQCWQRGEVPLRASETDAKMRTPRKAAERSGMSPAQRSLVEKPPGRWKPTHN